MDDLFTPPVDERAERFTKEPPESDDREIGFVLQTHPRGNGDLHERDTEYSAERWNAVLGW